MKRIETPDAHLQGEPKSAAIWTLEVQRDLAVAISTATSLHEALGHCLDAAMQVSGMDCGGIYLVDADGSLHLERHRGLGEAFIEASRAFPADSPNAHIVGEGAAVYTSYAVLADGPGRDLGLHEGLRVLGAIPISQAGRPVACLNLASHQLDEFSEEARISVEATAPLIGELLVRTRLHEEREQLREQLLQAQKMEAIGRLAGGVAHDINNVLTSIGGMAWIVLDECGEAPSVSVQRGDVELIADACERGRALVRDLLGFARRGRIEPEPLALGPLVQRSAQLLARTLPSSLRIVQRLEVEAERVLGDANQLQNVLMNLVLNASDAMARRGDVEVSTELVEIGAGDVDAGGLAAGRYIALRVRDQGTGMSPAVLARATEPFFTTKAQGDGTGLGLSMAFGVLESHGGRLEIESAEGQGTTVSCMLPVFEGAAEDLPEAARPPSLSPVSASPVDAISGCVLIVDDDADVRQVAERMLLRLGHRVRVATSGEEAVSLYRCDHREISAVLLDLMMPGMDGFETLAALREIDAELRVVVVSGYFAEERAGELRAQAVDDFVQKPFKLSELEAALGRAS